MVQNDSNSYIILLHGAVCDGQHNNVLRENYSVFYNNKVVASGAILVVFIRLVDCGCAHFIKKIQIFALRSSIDLMQQI